MREKIYIEELCVGESCGGIFDFMDIESLYKAIIDDIHTEEYERSLWSTEDEEVFGKFEYSLDDYFPVVISYGHEFDTPVHEITINRSENFKEDILSYLTEIFTE
jgi:hypothetical protein